MSPFIKLVVLRLFLMSVICTSVWSLNPGRAIAKRSAASQETCYRLSDYKFCTMKLNSEGEVVHCGYTGATIDFVLKPLPSINAPSECCRQNTTFIWELIDPASASNERLRFYLTASGGNLHKENLRANMAVDSGGVFRKVNSSDRTMFRLTTWNKDISNTGCYIVQSTHGDLVTACQNHNFVNEVNGATVTYRKYDFRLQAASCNI